MSNRRRQDQGGMALLFVFMMAAAIAIVLYMELPQVAFEGRRDKEQLLIDRGEQYTRAVKLYVRKMRNFPPTMEALEKSNNIRFLRRRYKDPMTGDEEWRIIHAAPGGILTDSLVQKPPSLNPNDKDKEKTAASAGTTDPNAAAGGGTNPILTRQRGGTLPAFPGQIPPPVDPTAIPPQNGSLYPETGNANPPVPADPNQPGNLPPIAGLPPGVVLPGQMPPGGVPVPGQVGSGQPMVPGQQPVPGQTNVPPSVPFPPTNAGVAASGIPPVPGGTTGANSALDAINRQLRGPAPAGVGPGTFGNAQQIGGGIAGVASKKGGPGIKVYNERTDYKEWEFVFDQRKEQQKQLQGMPGATPQNPNGPGPLNPKTPPSTKP